MVNINVLFQFMAALKADGYGQDKAVIFHIPKYLLLVLILNTVQSKFSILM